MNQEPNLEELFSNYHPTLSDSDAFMQTLSRRLDAVQYVERYQAAQRAHYRRYVIIALLVGVVLGSVSLAVILFLAPSAQFFTFRVQSDVLLPVGQCSPRCHLPFHHGDWVFSRSGTTSVCQRNSSPASCETGLLK